MLLDAIAAVLPAPLASAQVVTFLRRKTAFDWYTNPPKHSTLGCESTGGERREKRGEGRGERMERRGERRGERRAKGEERTGEEEVGEVGEVGEQGEDGVEGVEGVEGENIAGMELAVIGGLDRSDSRAFASEQLIGTSHRARCSQGAADEAFQVPPGERCLLPLAYSPHATCRRRRCLCTWRRGLKCVPGLCRSLVPPAPVRAG